MDWIFTAHKKAGGVCALIQILRSCLKTIRRNYHQTGSSMEFCSVALHVLHLLQNATKLIINTLTTDKILSVTKFCQWFFGFSAIGFFVGGMEFILLPIVDVLIDNLRD